MRLGLTFLLVLCAAVPARAGPPVGEPAPPIEIGRWVHAPDGETLAQLYGRVVVLLLEGACDLGDESAVQRWNDLRAAYLEKGCRVVAVLQREPKEVSERIEFSLAVAKTPAYGGGAAVMIAPDGKLAWHGEPGAIPEDLLAKLVKKAKEHALPKLDPAVKDAASLFKKGKIWDAKDLADVTEHPDAKLISKCVSERIAYRVRQAQRAKDGGDLGEWMVHLKWLSRYARGGVEGDDADIALHKHKGDKQLKKEVSAAKTYVRLRADLLKTKGKRKKIDALVKKAERFVERYAGTRGAERAARLVKAVKTDPALAQLRRFIAKEKIDTKGSSWRTSLPRPPQVAFSKDRKYFWNFETSEGPLRLRFYPDVAPMHVSSQIYLTELGFFDGLTFHRVIPGFMAQGGCPSGSGSGHPGYKYDGEFDDGAKHDRAGILSAAHSGPGTDGSQFFITFGPASHLDGKHTVYGELVAGEKTLKMIEKLGSSGGPTKKTITIEKATISVE